VQPAPVKDSTEPADQQVDKSPPKEPEPSSTDKVQDAKLPVKDKSVEKATVKEPQRQEKRPQELPIPVAGSRGETRVTFSLSL